MQTENHPLPKVQGGQGARPARSAERPDGPGGAAAPRLDKRTYLDEQQAHWQVRIRDYGDGLCEIGWSFVGIIEVIKAGRGFSDQRVAHEDRAVRRARSRLRQLILTANANYLLTLTYRENITDFRQTCGDLARFIRRVRRHLPRWVYIAVPENQKRGAWHWHIAVIGRQDVSLLRTCWRGVVGDGNIDVQRPKSGAANQRLAIVKYLGKYLAKGFDLGNRELNGHRFRASRGIEVPSESIAVPAEQQGKVAEFALDQLRSRAGSVGFSWREGHDMAGWACSWS